MFRYSELDITMTFDLEVLSWFTVASSMQARSI